MANRHGRQVGSRNKAELVKFVPSVGCKCRHCEAMATGDNCRTDQHEPKNCEGQ